MLVFPDTKIYVLCPSGARSDTADYCHQLCSQIARLGVEAIMVYLPAGSSNISVEEFYRKFHLPYDTGVEDSAKNILIVPEVASTFLYFTKQTRRVLWWVNVDSFFRDIGMRIVNQFDKILTKPMPRLFSFNRFDDDIEHWAQSEYARQFLKLNGVAEEKIYDVTDFLDRDFLDAAPDFAAKKDLVAFKPVQIRDFTDVVRKLSPNIEWRAVKNLTPENFVDAKVYVDFGDHASCDKLTRAAAISGCVVITGKRGAASNDADINIPAEFKFDETIDAAVAVDEKIRDVLANFDAEFAKQAEFREKILREKNLAAKNLTSTLGVSEPKKIPAALVHGLNDTGKNLAELLLKKDVEILPAFIIDDENNHSTMNLSDGRALPIISAADAGFLYGEGRIKKFVKLSDAPAELDFIKPAADDIVSLNFEES